MSAHITQQFSVFDLDRTLTRRPTWSPFLIYAARRAAPWRLGFIPMILGVMLAHKIGIVSRRRLKEMMHTLLLGRRVAAQQWQMLAADFADHQISTNMRDGCLALLKADHARGRQIIIATAAFDFYAEAIARKLGVTELVATKARFDRDILLASVDGENCYGTAKRDMVKAYFLSKGLDRAACHIRFYSDDASDIPTFDWADEPIAVSPSKRLRHHAERCGWTTYDWVQPTAGKTVPSIAVEAALLPAVN